MWIAQGLRSGGHDYSERSMTKTFARTRTKAKSFRDKAGPKADDFLILLSIISVAVVIANEFLPQKEFMVPWLNMSWSYVQQLLRAFTWASFTTIWLAMGLTSHRPLFYSRDPKKESYLRKWWLEA